MNIRIKNELVPLNLLVVILIIIINFLPANIFRIILALPFLLFFPGYTFMAALFPRKSQIGGIERIVLSLGLSIVIVPLIGLALNYTAWGIRLEPVLYSISIFIFAASIVAWLRRRRLPAGECFFTGCQFKKVSIRQSWAGYGNRGRVLSVILVIAILGTVCNLGYVVANPKVGERFTEFSVLGPEGRIEDYPHEIVAGDNVMVLLSIANREHETTTYRVEIMIDGQIAGTAGPVTLEHEQEWETTVNFTLSSVGDNQKAEFLLFKEGESEPYRSLHLWLNVSENR